MRQSHEQIVAYEYGSISLAQVADLLLVILLVVGLFDVLLLTVGAFGVFFSLKFIFEYIMSCEFIISVALIRVVRILSSFVPVDVLAF